MFKLLIFFYRTTKWGGILIFSGPFGYMEKDMKSIDFTAPTEQGFTTIVVPLVLKSDIWAISQPLADEVWYASIICVPIYLLMMGLADYAYFGMVKWKQLSGFILRNALSEHTDLPNIKKAYQHILIITWVASIFVLVQCYAGNLTAMLTAPGLPNPIKNATEFLRQNEISLVMEKGSIQEYQFKYMYSADTIQGKLGNIASVSDAPLTPTEYLKYGCYSTEQYNNEINAAVCSNAEFWGLISYDFSRTGHCNYYPTNDRFLTSYAVLGAFQK